MTEEKKQEILEKCEKEDVKFVKLWFTDIYGWLKSFAIMADELEIVLDEGMGFDGSSVTGFQSIEESDMVALPDPNTFSIIPWRPKEKREARLICDIYQPDGEHYEGDPRFVLKKNLERAEKMGYTYNVGPEIEYFYFKNSTGADILDSGGYFDLTPHDSALDLRRETIFALESMGIKAKYSHHEGAPSQHEIVLQHTDALTMSDNIITHKLAVKAIAELMGVYASFIPKPLFDQNGSGMHVHQSLFKDGKNAFFDPDDKYQLSDVAKKFVAGQLTHAREYTSIVAQWVNSYKRLVPGYEAPVYVAWCVRNRSALIRVPVIRPGREESTRVELRHPDPACNPYLAFAVILAAGLEGIENNYELPPPVEKNIYKMGHAEIEAAGLQSLPTNLAEAVAETENSELVRKALREHVFRNFVELKKKEWHRYNVRVHPFEIKWYLPRL